jgi:hypothetical protein
VLLAVHVVVGLVSAVVRQAMCLRHINYRTSAAAVLCCASASLPPPGSKLLWGGQPLQGHSIPKCYGAIQPTAVFVPLTAMREPDVFKLVTTEVFGPFQVITEYKGGCADTGYQSTCKCNLSMLDMHTCGLSARFSTWAQSLMCCPPDCLPWGRTCTWQVVVIRAVDMPLLLLLALCCAASGLYDCVLTA